MNAELTNQQLKIKAIEYDRILNRNVLESLLLLKEMYEEKLYTYLGFNSLEDYCLDRLGMARRTMFYYLDIASKFPQILQNFEEVQAPALTILGIEKLKILANLEYEKRLELQENGVVELNGIKYSINDFKQISCKELSDIIILKEEAQITDDSKGLPFKKVYNQAARDFTRTLNNLKRCTDIPSHDQMEIRIHLQQIIDIYEKHKKLNEAIKRIK